MVRGGNNRPLVAWITDKKIKLYFPGQPQEKARTWVVLEEE